MFRTFSILSIYIKGASLIYRIYKIQIVNNFILRKRIKQGSLLSAPCLIQRRIGELSQLSNADIDLNKIRKRKPVITHC